MDWTFIEIVGCIVYEDLYTFSTMKTVFRNEVKVKFKVICKS